MVALKSYHCFFYPKKSKKSQRSIAEVSEVLECKAQGVTFYLLSGVLHSEHSQETSQFGDSATRPTCIYTFHSFFNITVFIMPQSQLKFLVYLLNLSLHSKKEWSSHRRVASISSCTFSYGWRLRVTFLHSFSVKFVS